MKEQNRVSAVVLAGGFGTRLYPLTENKPKPLVKILDTEVLDFLLEKLESEGVTNITVSTHFHSEKIEKLCREKYPSAECKKETVPLGTAGGVKFCRDIDSDYILVVSGDAVFDFSLGEIIDFHVSCAADVTVVTSRSSDPTQFGVVVTDDEASIVCFSEKPPWKRVKSSLVNTGIYVLSKRIVDEIPDNVNCDFSKNLFPRLMREGRCLKAFTPDGFWCDIGTLDEYHACNIRAANGKLCCIGNDGVAPDELACRGVHADGNVYVSKSSIIGKNVHLSGHSVVCRDTHIGNNCDVASSVIGSGTRLGEGCSVSCAIIGENAAIGENCIIPEGCVIGDESRVADGAVLSRGQKIPCRTMVSGREGKNMFDEKNDIFVDDGLVVFDEKEALALVPRLARAVAAAFMKSEFMCCHVAVMCNEASEYLKNAFVSGVQSMGGAVFDCGVGSKNVCACSSMRLETDISVYLSLNCGKVNVSLFGDDGRVIDDADERKISKIFGLSEDGVSDSKAVNCTVKVPMKELYTVSLLKTVKKALGGRELDGIRAVLNKKQNASDGFDILEKALCYLSAQLVNEGGKTAINLSLSEGGTRASLRMGNTVLDHEHICAVIMKNKDVLGLEKMYVGENVPTVLKNMQSRGADKTGAGMCNLIYTDGVVALVLFLVTMSVRGESIDNLCREIPPFEIFADEYIGAVDKADAAERLSRLYQDSREDEGDGIRLSLADGNVTVIPNRAKGFRIVAEAVSMEAARELSVKIADIIKGKK